MVLICVCQGHRALHCPAMTVSAVPQAQMSKFAGLLGHGTTMVALSSSRLCLPGTVSERAAPAGLTSNCGPLQGEHSTWKVMWPQSGLSKDGLASSTCS